MALVMAHQARSSQVHSRGEFAALGLGLWERKSYQWALQLQVLSTEAPDYGAIPSLVRAAGASQEGLNPGAEPPSRRVIIIRGIRAPPPGSPAILTIESSRIIVGSGRLS
jgi:hypothetical protein